MIIHNIVIIGDYKNRATELLGEMNIMTGFLEASTGQKPRGRFPESSERDGFIRAVMDASSAPGKIHAIHWNHLHHSLSPAAHAVCFALLDHKSSVWLSSDARRDPVLIFLLLFQYGADCYAKSSEAQFALMNARERDGLNQFRTGIPARPQSSATVIIEVDNLYPGGGFEIFCAASWRPGRIGIVGFDEEFVEDVNRNHAFVPYSLDFILTCRNQLVAITRNCRMTQNGV